MINLHTLTVDDVLARLNSTEKNVSVMQCSSENGWQPTIAWNPVDVLEVPFDYTANPTEIIESFMSRQKDARRLVIGYVSYDLGCLLHNVALTTEDDLQTPLAYIMAFDAWIRFDGTSSYVHKSSKKFINEIQQIMARLPREIPRKIYRTTVSPVWSRDAYNTAYKKVKDYIQAGDIYQANLTHRLEGITDVRGIDIFRKVSMSSNADFQSYIGAENFEVISASPERFVRIRDGIIQTMPIKGTRRRGVDGLEDEALRQDLETNPKDMAELDMITDLMRNDLGAISRVGSVEVIERRALTSYPTLWHAHSEIRATLRDDVSPIGSLLSLLPGGSITGCPKKRAMEIIDEVEAKRRGVYTGSLFTVQPDGELDSNIAIRTMVKKSNNIYLSVGGGIVYDSNETDEYEESLQKAASFLTVDD